MNGGRMVRPGVAHPLMSGLAKNSLRLLRRIRATVGPLFVLAMLGCAVAGPASDAVEFETPEAMQAWVRQAQLLDPYLRTQQDVGLEARIAAPGLLQVTVVNKTDRRLTIGPENFGIIIPGRREVQMPLAASRATFPPMDLAPGEQAGGTLRFGGAVPAPGQRLAFQHPQCRPALAPIH